MNDINVALVGPGAIGERHLRALQSRGGHVNAVVSWYADEAAAFAAEHGIKVHTTDLDVVLSRSDVDAVSATLIAPDGDLASFALSYHSRASGGSMVVIGEDETYTVRDGALVSNGETLTESGGYDAMMAAAWADQDGEFLDSIREGRMPSFDLGDALPAMRAMAKIAGARVPPVAEPGPGPSDA